MPLKTQWNLVKNCPSCPAAWLAPAPGCQASWPSSLELSQVWPWKPTCPPSMLPSWRSQQDAHCLLTLILQFPKQMPPPPTRGLPGFQPGPSPLSPWSQLECWKWQHLKMLPRASSCHANPDVSDAGKQANEAAEDCTPHSVSLPNSSISLATQLLGQMWHQKGAGFTAVRLPGHGCGYWNIDVWLELNGLHWLPLVLFFPSMKLEKSRQRD